MSVILANRFGVFWVRILRQKEIQHAGVLGLPTLYSSVTFKKNVRSSTSSSVQTNESGLLLTLDLLDYFVDFDMFYDLKRMGIDRYANKSKKSTNVAPIAACGLILLATRMFYKRRYRISIVLAFSCGRAKHATC